MQIYVHKQHSTFILIWQHIIKLQYIITKMAEGGESEGESLTLGLCELCLEDDNEVKAKYFCLQCEQNMCLECKNYHRKVKVSKSHHRRSTFGPTFLFYHNLLFFTFTCSVNPASLPCH